MQFVLYSDIDERSIRENLGKPEYSYYFVLKTFRPAFEQLGDVVLVHRPAEEVDPIYEACAARGEPCIFVSFSPPNSVPLGLKCPTIVVFAWEFSTLPDGAWDPGNPRSDWRYVLRTLGHAICLSGYTARVVEAEMGMDFPIFPIACPVWNRVVKADCVEAGGPLISARELRIRGTIIDTATLTLAPEMIFAPGFPPPPEPPVIIELAPEAPVAKHEPLVGESVADAAPMAALQAEPDPQISEPIIEAAPNPDTTDDPPWTGEGVAEEASAPPLAEDALAPPLAEDPLSVREPTAECGADLPAVEPESVVRNWRYMLAVTKRHGVDWYREAVRDLLPKPLRRLVSYAGVSAEKLYRRRTGWQQPAPAASDLLCGESQPAVSTAYPEPHPGLRRRLAVTKRHALEWYRQTIRDFLPRPIQWVVSRSGALTEWLYRRLTGWRPPGSGHESAAPTERRTLRYRLAVTKHHAIEWYREALRDLVPRPLRWIISRSGRLMEMIYRRLVGWRPPAPIDGAAAQVSVPEPEAMAPPEPEQVPEPEAMASPEQVPEPEAVQEPDPEPAPVELAPPPPEEPELQIAPPEPPPPAEPPRPLQPEASVEVSGLVYTAVLNPGDGRKNWQDIMTAFCWAFRDSPDATLILKMIKGESHSYRHELFIMLAQLAPFKCRIITMDGFLEEEAYAGLIDATSYYVNASNAEGLCLPLMEFMALGKPAIAPRHTAMEDYIDPSAAFIVESSPEHNVWPNDPRQRFHTMRERIHWDTLVEAYEESYRVAKTDEARYRAMSIRASAAIRDYSSDSVIRERLRLAIANLTIHAGAAQAANDEPARLLEAAAT